METLADRIVRDGPLNELDAVGWIIRLAKKLEALHARGHAHGGISPSAVKTATVSRTSLGMLLAGSTAPNRLEFHSPDRLLQGTSTPADDTWATAATLYNLLTGASPFSGADEDATQQKILAANPAPLATFDVGDDDLQHILDAALTRDMNRRSSTMAALRQALEGWHPDPTVRDLPPIADDQPMADEDEEERTQMRPLVGAVHAMRAATTRKDLPNPPPMREPAKTVPNMPAVTSALAAATVPGAPLPRAHDLLEDDDENAKTSLMRVPMVPMRRAAPPAAAPAPARPAPPPIAQAPASSRIGTAPASARAPLAPPVVGQPLAPMARPAGGPAARALQAARSGAPSQRTPLAPPVPTPPPSGISRDAVIDDGDEEATVMREAPLELLMSSKSEGGSEADRATPVNPVPAEVAAAAAVGNDLKTPPAPKPEETTPRAPDALGSTPRDPLTAGVKPPEPRAPEPTMLLPQEDEPATLYIEPKAAAPLLFPPEPAAAPVRQESLPDLFSSTNAERPELAVNPNMAAAMPMANGPQQMPAPLAAPPAEASATKGLIIGILLALVLLAAGAAAYFLVLKKP